MRPLAEQNHINCLLTVNNSINFIFVYSWIIFSLARKCLLLDLFVCTYGKDVVDMRKPLIPRMLEARKQGKHAAFSRAEPYKLFIDGKQFN